MPKLVTIYGGSGFVGRHIARRMAKEGWLVRVAVRRPNEALFVKPYGTVGQVEPFPCNIRDDASVEAALQGADAVVNCVGVLGEHRKNTFDATMAEGAGRIARLAAAHGVETMVHLSAIGADIDSDSEYAQAKAKGEAAVLEHMPNAMILRPSVIFGQGDGFFNRFGSLSRFGPFLPVVGADTRFQPVYVDDVAAAAVQGVLGKASGTFELGGPKVATLREFVQETIDVAHRKRIILNMPNFLARFMAFCCDLTQTMLFDLIENKVLTRDQVRLLQEDNVVTDGAKTLADLGIQATNTESVLPEYLWRYRPSGQYDAIKDSAKNLNV